MPRDNLAPQSKFSGTSRPFRSAVLRGLGVVAPPLLTLVILLWVIRTVDYYVLGPVTLQTRNVLGVVADQGIQPVARSAAGPHSRHGHQPRRSVPAAIRTVSTCRWRFSTTC